MTLIETAAETRPGLQCQIFATDISEDAIDRAGMGSIRRASRRTFRRSG
jgi:chemotaxis methyl-accepting protein methylase